MAKLSKIAATRHKQALDLVHSDKRLSLDDRYFILENFQESATNMNGLAGAFFTPEGLAVDLCVEVPDCDSMIDLCAGIGRLAFTCSDRAKRIVCVEMNPDYAEVGKRVLPEAEWIVGDVFALEDLGRFKVAISNPPFGSVKTGKSFKGQYTGASFEYKVIEAASKIADYGVFIIPQTSAPFRYSGRRSYSVEITNECRKFMDQTGVVLDHNCGLDTSAYLSEWHGVSPMCEIVTCDFLEPREAVEVIKPPATQSLPVAAPIKTTKPAAAQVLAARSDVAPVVCAPAPGAASQRVAKPSTASSPQLSLFDAA